MHWQRKTTTMVRRCHRVVRAAPKAVHLCLRRVRAAHLLIPLILDEEGDAVGTGVKEAGVLHPLLAVVTPPEAAARDRTAGPLQDVVAGTDRDPFLLRRVPLAALSRPTVIGRREGDGPTLLPDQGQDRSSYSIGQATCQRRFCELC